MHQATLLGAQMSNEVIAWAERKKEKTHFDVIAEPRVEVDWVGFPPEMHFGGQDIDGEEVFDLHAASWKS